MWYEDVDSMEMDYPDEFDQHMYILPEEHVSLPDLGLKVGCAVAPPPTANINIKPCRHNTSCAICLESIAYDKSDNQKLVYCQQQCGQVFHEQCMNQWERTSCPICRCKTKPCGRP